MDENWNMSRDTLVLFGRVIRKYRQMKGYSQEQLADLCNLHRTYIGGVERGERNITLLNMVRIAKTLEVPLSVIIQEVEAFE